MKSTASATFKKPEPPYPHLYAGIAEKAQNRTCTDERSFVVVGDANMPVGRRTGGIYRLKLYTRDKGYSVGFAERHGLRT